MGELVFPKTGEAGLSSGGQVVVEKFSPLCRPHNGPLNMVLVPGLKLGHAWAVVFKTAALKH